MSSYISSIISLVDLDARASKVLTVVWGLDSDEGESENCLSCFKFGFKFDQFIQLNLVEGTDVKIIYRETPPVMHAAVLYQNRRRRGKKTGGGVRRRGLIPH